MTDISRVYSVRDLLNRLLGKKEPETVILSLAEFPRIFREQEDAITQTFSASAAEPIHTIRNAEAQLRHIVNIIEGAEHDPELHPKLKAIAKNTLPQFVRSMNSALAKELPDDPEEFYTASVELVKGCLNSVRGPGRYLQIVFPEEMKATRKGIDTIGREINNLTKALGTYRSAMTATHEARADYENLIRAHADFTKAADKESRIGQRFTDITNRLETIGRELEALGSDPRMADAEAKKNALHVLETRRDETARAYASFSMTASHVLRKAEKIAVRQKHPGEIALIRQAMTLLSDHELPEPAYLEQTLTEACPVALRMIETGEIPLKNREERAIFADTLRFREEMRTCCTRLMCEEEECRKGSEELALHPALAKQNSLQREKTQLLAMLEREREAQTNLTLFRERTKEEIPLLARKLCEKVGVIIGKNVQVQGEDTIPA